jgi:hypothetical protein
MAGISIIRVWGSWGAGIGRDIGLCGKKRGERRGKDQGHGRHPGHRSFTLRDFNKPV